MMMGEWVAMMNCDSNFDSIGKLHADGCLAHETGPNTGLDHVAAHAGPLITSNGYQRLTPFGSMASRAFSAIS